MHQNKQTEREAEKARRVFESAGPSRGPFFGVDLDLDERTAVSAVYVVRPEGLRLVRGDLRDADARTIAAGLRRAGSQAAAFRFEGTTVEELPLPEARP